MKNVRGICLLILKRRFGRIMLFTNWFAIFFGDIQWKRCMYVWSNFEMGKDREWKWGKGRHTPVGNIFCLDDLHFPIKFKNFKGIRHSLADQSNQIWPQTPLLPQSTLDWFTFYLLFGYSSKSKKKKHKKLQDYLLFASGWVVFCEVEMERRNEFQ